MIRFCTYSNKTLPYFCGWDDWSQNAVFSLVISFCFALSGMHQHTKLTWSIFPQISSLSQGTIYITNRVSVLCDPFPKQESSHHDSVNVNLSLYYLLLNTFSYKCIPMVLQFQQSNSNFCWQLSEQGQEKWMSFIDLLTKSILFKIVHVWDEAANKAVFWGSLGSCVSLCVFIPRIMDGITRLNIQEFTPPRRNLSDYYYKLAFSMLLLWGFFGTNSLATWV